jgi:hypothetical protein
VAHLYRNEQELGALETPDDAFKGAFTPEQLRSKYKIEADKRVQSRAIIAKRRGDTAKTLDNFVQSAATRYASTGQGQEIQKNLAGAVRNVSGRWQMKFDLLDRKR